MDTEVMQACVGAYHSHDLPPWRMRSDTSTHVVDFQCPTLTAVTPSVHAIAVRRLCACLLGSPARSEVCATLRHIMTVCSVAAGLHSWSLDVALEPLVAHGFVRV